MTIEVSANARPTAIARRSAAIGTAGAPAARIGRVVSAIR